MIAPNLIIYGICIVAKFSSIYAILCYAPSPIFTGNSHDQTMQGSTKLVRQATTAKFWDLYHVNPVFCLRNSTKTILTKHSAHEQQIIQHSQSKSSQQQTIPSIISVISLRIQKAFAGKYCR